MDYIVLLPVYNNHLLFKNYTYLFLKQYNLQSKCILLIQNDKDAEDYAQFKDIKQERCPQGKGASINYMSHILPLDCNIVCIDDDVTGLMDINQKYIRDVNELFIEMFSTMNKENITLGGFYPTPNPYFMKSRPEITTHLAFCVGSLFLFINRGILLEASGKDDYMFSIENFKECGKVMRYNHVAIRFQYEGNLEKSGDLEDFVSRYGEYIQYVRHHKKKNTSSIVLKKLVTELR